MTNFRENYYENLQNAMLYFQDKGILTNAARFWWCLGALHSMRKKQSQNTFKKIKEHSCIEQVAILHDLVVTGKKHAYPL